MYTCVVGCMHLLGCLQQRSAPPSAKPSFERRRETTTVARGLAARRSPSASSTGSCLPRSLDSTGSPRWGGCGRAVELAKVGRRPWGPARRGGQEASRSRSGERRLGGRAPPSPREDPTGGGCESTARTTSGGGAAGRTMDDDGSSTAGGRGVDDGGSSTCSGDN
jgi:hypothetical protein